MIDFPTRVVATFTPDHAIHLTTELPGDVAAWFIVTTGRALVPFDNLGDAIALCLHNCGWGDFTIAAEVNA